MSSYSFSTGINSAVPSPITLTPSSYPLPPRRDLNHHNRSISASSIDPVTLSRYGYPTYRHAPTYISTEAHYTPSIIPGSSIFVPPPSPVTRYRPIPYELPVEQQFTQADDATMTPGDYLRAANPAVGIVRNTTNVLGRGMHLHFWWDIRNLRPWDGFSLDRLLQIPHFPELLRVDVNAASLPQPTIAPARLRPESEAALIGLVRDFYVAKVNAALQVALGRRRYVAMRRGGERERDGPHFLTSCYDAGTGTVSGNGRGRVVGLVRSYERWNTGMRLEAPHRKILYLEGLAQLQRWMREHFCRYGWLMTETELVCVRAGTGDVPFFGELEVAATIEMRTHGTGTGAGAAGTEGKGGDGTKGALTACLALWWLNMMAKDEALAGEAGWKVSVGGPAAMTRRKVRGGGRDGWIPEAQVGEKRDAKRMRGWVMPEDPWNKRKEGGKVWCQ